MDVRPVFSDRPFLSTGYYRPQEMKQTDFDQVVEQGRALQRRFPDLGLVAVGGTAAALYCQHRYSVDADMVTPHLQARYQEVLRSLESWEDWVTNRQNPPVLILGERRSVDLGLRQQRRLAPLQTAQVQGLVVPSLAEMLRIKAWLLSQRRATRDYVDVAALAKQLPEAEVLQALSYLNLLYAFGMAHTPVKAFAEACESEPLDLATVDVSTYKGLRAPFTDWSHVASSVRSLGRALLKLELEDRLPRHLDFQNPHMP